MPLFNTYIDKPEVAEDLTAFRRLEAEDGRVRRNIQWGIVRGLFLYSLIMVPVAVVVALLISK
jgi:hypothetical protein